MLTNRTFKTFKHLPTSRRLRTQKNIESLQTAKEGFFNELSEQLQTFLSPEELQFLTCRMASQAETAKKRKRETISLGTMKTQLWLPGEKKKENTDNLDQCNYDLFQEKSSTGIRLSGGECQNLVEKSRPERDSEGEEWRAIQRKFQLQLALAHKKVKKEAPRLPSELEEEQAALHRQLQKLQRGAHTSKLKQRKYATNIPRCKTLGQEIDLTSIPKEFLGQFSTSALSKTTDPHRLKTEPDREVAVKMECLRSGIRKRGGARYHRMF